MPATDSRDARILNSRTMISVNEYHLIAQLTDSNVSLSQPVLKPFWRFLVILVAMVIVVGPLPRVIMKGNA